jgi:hypothetical protein
MTSLRTSSSPCSKSSFTLITRVFPSLIVLAAGVCAGCESGQARIPNIFRGGHSTLEVVDPARTAFHGWGAVDAAVSRAALELFVIARPIGGDGVHTREYTLKTLQGKPGELLVSRRGVGLGIGPSDGLTIECRLGRHGEKELELELLEKIAASLIVEHRNEHE